MKKVVYLGFTLLCVLVFQACKKDHHGESKSVTIDTTITSGTEYTLNLAQYGDRDDVASIVKQATAYTKSEITDTTGDFASVYHYQAFAKTELTDQVVLKVSEGNRNGNNHSHHSDSTLITINFTVK